MNKIKWMVLSALLLTAVTGYSQAKDKNTMIKKVFEVLKNKDEEGFVKLFPDAAIMKDFVMKMMGNDTSGSQMNEAMMEAIMGKMNDSSLHEEFSRDFNENIRKGEEAGVNWSGATLVSYNADSTMTTEDGIEVAKLSGKIYFSSGSKTYFLLFDDIIWFENRGWYGIDIKRIDEKSKENEPEANAWEEITDTAVTAPAAPAPKAEKEKPKQKVKPTEKNKSQAPARKSE